VGTGTGEHSLESSSRRVQASSESSREVKGVPVLTGTVVDKIGIVSASQLFSARGDGGDRRDGIDTQSDATGTGTVVFDSLYRVSEFDQTSESLETSKSIGTSKSIEASECVRGSGEAGRDVPNVQDRAVGVPEHVAIGVGMFTCWQGSSSAIRFRSASSARENQASGSATDGLADKASIAEIS